MESEFTATEGSASMQEPGPGSKADLRGRWRRWVPPVVMMLFGGLLWISLFVFMLSSIIDEMADYHRLVVPGEMEVALPEAGSYRVYFESRSRVDGRDYASSASPRDMRLLLIATDGREMTLAPFNGTSTYEFGHFSGEAIGVFHVPGPDSYIFRAGSGSGQGSPTAVVALQPSPSSIPTTVLLLAGGMCAGGTFVVAGMVWLSVLLIKHLAGSMVVRVR